MASSRRPKPQARAPQGSRYPGRAAPPSSPLQAAGPGRSWTTPDASPLRQRIELASRGPLVRVNAMPRWLLFLVFLGLAVGAALAPGAWGSLCALVLAMFLGWLLVLAWPRLAFGSRAVRLVVVLALVGLAAGRLVVG